MCKVNSQPVHIVSTTQSATASSRTGCEAMASVVPSHQKQVSLGCLQARSPNEWGCGRHHTECLASAENPNSIMVLSNAIQACSGTLGVPSKACWMEETRESRASGPSPRAIVDSKRFIGWRFEAIQGVREALPSACWPCATPWQQRSGRGRCRARPKKAMFFLPFFATIRIAGLARAQGNFQ